MSRRADTLLFEQGLAPSREKARQLIKEGYVFLLETPIAKPSQMLADDAKLSVRGRALPYVGRGGLKLEKAIAQFAVSLKGCVCADIGCSTGGFTDCMLQNGAVHVFAVDVGTDQLVESLRKDARVTVLEKTNARYLTREIIPVPLDFVSVDVSFISLKLILPALAPLVKPSARLVCLVKPQFEAGRERLGKNGVVRDPLVHEQVLSEVLNFAREYGFYPAALSYSPIKGPQGNIEFLLLLSKASLDVSTQIDIKHTVKSAHKCLKVET